MDARALIENIENYPVVGRSHGIENDSRSNPSTFHSPVQLRRRAFDSTFYFDEHTKQRNAKNRNTRHSSIDRHQTSGSEKQVHRITPTKVYQGVIFNVPDILDDAPPVDTRDDTSLLVPDNTTKPIDCEYREDNGKSETHLYRQPSSQAKCESIMVETVQRKDHVSDDVNTVYWTTVAIKVAQSIVVNGGKLHHAEEAQMIILECARDQSLSWRKDGATFIASKLSTTLLELGASEHVIAKAVTMYLKCVSVPDISMMDDAWDTYSPLKRTFTQGHDTGPIMIEKSWHSHSPLNRTLTQGHNTGPNSVIEKGWHSHSPLKRTVTYEYKSRPDVIDHCCRMGGAILTGLGALIISTCSYFDLDDSHFVEDSNFVSDRRSPRNMSRQEEQTYKTNPSESFYESNSMIDSTTYESSIRNGHKAFRGCTS